MGIMLTDIQWVEGNTELEQIILGHHNLLYAQLEQGEEAEVILVKKNQEKYVLKVWNKNSNPDVGLQYSLLSALYNQNRAVSKPYGWGKTAAEHNVLFTSFDGGPLTKLDGATIQALAHMLNQFHTASVTELGSTLPNYNFIGCFFYRLEEFSYLQPIVHSFVQSLPLRRDCLIHGDYHPRNIVEQDGKYRVIDWTNGQLGDYRFDVAWSVFLQSIYVSERVGKAFLLAYQALNPISKEEYEQFEALACMRWLLLHRLKAVPYDETTYNRVKEIITSNKYLVNLDIKVVL